MANAQTSHFADELKQMIASSPYVMVNHPFVEGINQGTIPIHQVRGWAIQDSHYRRAVPRLSMVRYIRCTDPEIQHRLAGVVAEEAEGGQYGSSGHYQLFLSFAKAIGLTEEEVRDSRPLAVSAAHVYWAELIAWTQPWFVAMAAQLAGEGQFPPCVEKLASGFQKHYGVSSEDAAFFDVHGEADEEHGTLAEDIVNRYLVTPDLQNQARAIVQRKLELQWDMWNSFQAF